MTQKLKQKIIDLYDSLKRPEIQIRCEARDSLPLDVILDFQGKLKKRTEANLLKLIGRIFKLGFIAPFFIWEHEGAYYDLDGHGRSEALCAIREAGIAIPGLFPVAYIQADDKEQAREVLLSISSQYGEFDEDELSLWLDDLGAEIAEQLRLVDTEIERSIREETEGDDEFEEDVEPVTKAGDLWELGRHRLLCGSALETTHVEKLCSGILVDLFLTDPPYNVDYVGKTKKALRIHGDKQTDTGFREFLTICFTNAVNVMKNGAPFYIWHADSEGFNFRFAVKEAGFDVRQCLIWNKNVMVMGRQDYQWKHEPCLYGWKFGAAHFFYGDRSQTTVLNFDRPSRSEEHPTMKPVALFEYQVINSTKEDDILLDFFVGSGTSIIVSEKTGRICFAMDNDPRYCDVSVNRYKTWCEQNGKTPEIKLNGEPYSI